VRGIKDALRDERGRLIVIEDGSITIQLLQGRLSAVRQRNVSECEIINLLVDGLAEQ
jgi:hypothetical protein